MKTIKITSKAALGYVGAYGRSTDTELRDVYKSFSTEKSRGDFQARMMCAHEGGEGYKIIGHNCNFFTVAWTVGNDLRIRTAYNDFIIPDGALYECVWQIQYQHAPDAEWDEVCDYDDSSSGYKEARRDLDQYRESGTPGEYRIRRVLSRK